MILRTLALLILLVAFQTPAYAGPLQGSVFRFGESQAQGPAEKFTLKWGTESGVYTLEREIPREHPNLHSETVLLDVDKTYYFVVTATNVRGESAPSEEIVVPGKPGTPVGFSVEYLGGS